LRDFAKSPVSQTPAVELWRQTLSQIPTVFGRLVYLASLRDEATGRYVHDALTRLQGSDEANRTLCHSHQQVFSQWIASSLFDQKRDLDQYAMEIGGRIQSLWNLRDVVPPMARDVERQLYLADFETLLGLLQFDHDAASSNPGASPRQ
jgi:hypothetical protein